MQRKTFFGPAPWEGSKCQILFNFNYKVNFKDFYARGDVGGGGGALGHWGYPGGQTIFFQTWPCNVAYQIDGDDEQNKMQVTFSSSGQTGDLWARSKNQVSLTCQFQRFLYQTLCVFSQIKDRKHIEQNFHSVAKVMPRGGAAGR